MVIEFLLSFILALLTGQVYTEQGSAITSDSDIPYITTEFDWYCYQWTMDKEMCFIRFDSEGNLWTGP